jgi:DNA-binding NtrC family response regulator
MARKNQSRGPVSNGGMPILALLSHDDQLTQTIEGVAHSEWSVIKPKIAEISNLVREPNVRLVIFDDQSVPTADRGHALSEIQRYASKASIIYVAGNHDHESERQARGRGVLFYTAKPLIPGDVILLLQRLLHLPSNNHGLANRQVRGQG